MRYIFLTFFIALVALRVFLSLPHFSEGHHYSLSGTVTTEPILLYGKSSFFLGGIRMSVKSAKPISYGDWIQVRGTYLQGKLTDVQVTTILPASDLFSKLRERWATFFQSSLPAPHAGLLTAIVL